jgi:hypothetical protein
MCSPLSLDTTVREFVYARYLHYANSKHPVVGGLAAAMPELVASMLLRGLRRLLLGPNGGLEASTQQQLAAVVRRFLSSSTGPSPGWASHCWLCYTGGRGVSFPGSIFISERMNISFGCTWAYSSASQPAPLHIKHGVALAFRKHGASQASTGVGPTPVAASQVSSGGPLGRRCSMGTMCCWIAGSLPVAPPHVPWQRQISNEYAHPDVVACVAAHVPERSSACSRLFRW